MPRDRDGRFSTELFERYQRSEKALVSALAEMYVQGVSTRKVKAVTEELCGHAFSASTISQINKGLDGALSRFANRPLQEAYLASWTAPRLRSKPICACFSTARRACTTRMKSASCFRRCSPAEMPS